MEKRKKNKGSLTVEAVISVTVFISVMFLLLTMVKMVLVMTVLNNATVEAAKVIATSGYPIALLNEMQAEKLDAPAKQFESLSLENSLKAGAKNTLITGIFSGDVVGAAKNDAVSSLKSLIEQAGKYFISEYVYQAKADIANVLCSSIVKDYVQDCGLYIDQEKLILRAVKIPETAGEFKVQHSGDIKLSEAGELVAKPNQHFGADDVLICLEYPYEIALPFLPAFEVTLRSTSVERAWVNGTGTGVKFTEGIKISQWLAPTYYVGSRGYSKCYHLESCYTLWRGKKPITASEAKSLNPCKVCNPGPVR